jgi:replication-associated recombination protein RarA
MKELIWWRTQIYQTKKLRRNDELSKLLNKNIKLKKDLLKQKEITLDTNLPDLLGVIVIRT